jgi:hypothetical protein
MLHRASGLAGSCEHGNLTLGSIKGRTFNKLTYLVVCRSDNKLNFGELFDLHMKISGSTNESI